MFWLPAVILNLMTRHLIQNQNNKVNKPRYFTISIITISTLPLAEVSDLKPKSSNNKVQKVRQTELTRHVSLSVEKLQEPADDALAALQKQEASFKQLVSKPFNIDSKEKWERFDGKVKTSSFFRNALAVFFKTSSEFSSAGNIVSSRISLMLNFMFAEDFLASHVSWFSNDKEIKLRLSSFNQVIEKVFGRKKCTAIKAFSNFFSKLEKH